MTPLKNPLPADFDTHRGKPVKAQMAIYGVGKHTIARWRSMTGVKGLHRAWSDADLLRLKELSQQGISTDTAARMMGRGRRSVLNAFSRYKMGEWKGASRRPPMLPVPDDFAASWDKMTLEQLADHYTVSVKTVQRWVEAKGLKRERKAANVRAVDFQRQPPEKRQRFNRDRYVAAPANTTVQRDMSPEGQARDILQRDRWTVFRANAEGRADVAGRFWICGRSLLTDEQLVERAERAMRRMGV